MKISFGCDDSNEVTEAVRQALIEEGHDLLLVETDQPWPLIGRAIAMQVANNKADFGVALCWTGTGMGIAANKVDGIRAAVVSDVWTAENARRWNNANVLCMSLKQLKPELAVQILRAFLAVSEPDDDELENIALLG